MSKTEDKYVACLNFVLCTMVVVFQIAILLPRFESNICRNAFLVSIYLITIISAAVIGTLIILNVNGVLKNKCNYGYLPAIPFII
jgi:predicted membrane protein